MSALDRAGIYIHIPFCLARCSYCDFATGMYERDLVNTYVDAVAKEIVEFNNVSSLREVDTIYFGGGTPSLLAPPQLAQLLDATRRRFSVLNEAEVTMEMNPGTVTSEIVQRFRELGVNRASFGVQTFDDDELKRLGRTHSADDARETLRLLRGAGIANISFDLIAGLPEQTIERWSANLDEAFKLRPEHLSLYLLEIHEGTPMAEQVKQGRWRTPDADVAAEMYELMARRARDEGYVHYEISNFCLPGYESRHNTKYWTTAPYYGFGCSAHSFDGRLQRWQNETDTRRYIDVISTNGAAVVETTELDERAASAEALFLGLRLLDRGVDLAKHRQRFERDVLAEHAADFSRFDEAGLIELDGEILRLTPQGALLSNEVFAAFV